MSTLSYSAIISERSLNGREPSTEPGVKNKFLVRNLAFWYGKKQALFDVSLAIPERSVVALIGPSGCGKSTFLRSLNRMNDLIEGTHHTGDLLLDGVDIYSRSVNLVDLRRRVGMVFQKSNPFPKSVFENVVYGPRVAGLNDRAKLAEIVERCLRGAALWDEVKDRLNDSALNLSGGQAQRLCIARALATDPEVILLDEPASALDPASTARIEDLIFELKHDYTIVIVTHNMQQAARVSDRVAFFFQGRLIEAGPTDQLYTRPQVKQTEDYITGRFGSEPPRRIGELVEETAMQAAIVERPGRDGDLQRYRKRIDMAKHLQRDLDGLQKDMLALAGLVEGAVHKAIQALQKRDVDLAHEVIDGDGRIDHEENHIDEECLKILALHQPVAVDLRLIAAAMLINVDLERIGDLAEEIAERAIHLAQPPLLAIPEKLQRMTDMTTMMLREALDAYVGLNKAQAQAVMRMDDEVDRYNSEIIHETVEEMKKSPELIEAGLSMFSAVRHLERIADHATNIAEDVIYLIDGEIVRHRSPPHRSEEA